MRSAKIYAGVLQYSNMALHKFLVYHTFLVSQTLRKQKYGNYVVIVIGKFEFAMSSGNAGLLPRKQVGGLTLFARIRFCLVICLCSSIMPFSTVQHMFIVEHYFRTQSYEAAFQVRT
jgi:hypothetical protein